MAGPAVFQLADRALARVVAQITPEQWEITLPTSFTTQARPEPPSLRTLINYHAYDDAWVPHMLAGLTMDEAGSDMFDGDLLGEDPVTSFEAIVDRACAAASAVTDPDVVAHLSFGDYPVREYFWQINQFRALGPPHRPGDRCGPRLAGGAGAGSVGRADSARRGVAHHRGVSGRVPVPEDAPLLHPLLGLTGRSPAPA